MKVEIFTEDVIEYLIDTAKEDAVTLQKFKDTLESKLSNMAIATIAWNWESWNEDIYEDIANIHVGIKQIDMFILLMNYLSDKIKIDNI